MSDTIPDLRDIPNDVEWLRTIANNADEIDSDFPNQMLWPETIENLRDIAEDLRQLHRDLRLRYGGHKATKDMPTHVYRADCEACQAEARLRDRFGRA